MCKLSFIDQQCIYFFYCLISIIWRILIEARSTAAPEGSNYAYQLGYIDIDGEKYSKSKSVEIVSEYSLTIGAPSTTTKYVVYELSSLDLFELWLIPTATIQVRAQIILSILFLTYIAGHFMQKKNG